MISPTHLLQIIEGVQQKKEYTNLSEHLIEQLATEYVRLNPKVRDFSPKSIKEIIKHVRAKTRDIYSVFQIPSRITKRSIEDAQSLVMSHLSTKERQGYYDAFLQDIFDAFKPDSVLDLAAGMNPIKISQYYPSIRYVANELSLKDCDLLLQYFAFHRLHSYTAVAFDCVREHKKITSLGNFDLCLALKCFDTFETQRLYCSYDILQAIQAKIIVASFPLQNVKGQVMKRTTISWFEKVLTRLAFVWKKKMYQGELMYIIAQDSALLAPLHE
ncbi:MAG: hypothetical protein ACMXYF_00850 [Candidatus Woesearchaeota archaeon]